MALGEMTKEKNVEPEWQGPAAVILVTVGRRFPQPVWTVLVELFPPGTTSLPLPTHYLNAHRSIRTSVPAALPPPINIC